MTTCRTGACAVQLMSSNLTPNQCNICSTCGQCQAKPLEIPLVTSSFRSMFLFLFAPSTLLMFSDRRFWHLAVDAALHASVVHDQVEGIFRHESPVVRSGGTYTNKNALSYHMNNDAETWLETPLGTTLYGQHSGNGVWMQCFKLFWVPLYYHFKAVPKTE